MKNPIRKGRPKRHAQFEALKASLPPNMRKRPIYHDQIGLFRGERGITVWIKIVLKHGGLWKGRFVPPGRAVEIKQGNLESFTWDQLIDRRNELQGRADRGEPLEVQAAPLFADWASAWLDRARPRHRAFQTTEVNVRVHLLPAFGQKRLTEIRVQDVNRWIADQLRNLKPSTVKRHLNTLVSILNDAKRAGEIDENPCDNADPVRGIVPRQRFLTIEEMSLLLAAAKTEAEWLYDFLLWALHSGMRKQEILNLVWSDIRDFEDGRVLALVRHGKSDKVRQVPCTKTMIEVLERQRERRQSERDKVFPLVKMTLRRKWERARKAAGLDDANIHDLRRTHTTQAAANNVDLRTLADRIGHSDLTMLQNVYAAVVGSRAFDAADTIEGIFSGATR